MEEGHSCDNCIHYKCYDDGDGRYDIWCSASRLDLEDAAWSTYKPNNCDDFKSDGDD